MGKEYQEIDDKIRRWLKRQKLFFVATAPRADDGLINCSPKGMDTLRVTGAKQLTYADTGGSGIETVAHLRENGRIVVMLCAFDGPPKIFRFYGTGRVVEPHKSEFEKLMSAFPPLPCVRNFIVIDIDRIRDSCGYGVPLYDYQKERDSYKNWRDDKTDEELLQYRIDRNAESLDGLPGLNLEELRLQRRRLTE